MTIHSTPADGVTLIEFTGRDLAAEALDESGRQRVLPASFYAGATIEERAVFCVKHGIYGLVTQELVAFVRENIGPRSAIEIGAGDGVLAGALGIQAFDNYMQAWPDIAKHYEAMHQAPVRYGHNVIEKDGVAAAKEYSPRVIVASWLTHLYRPEAHERGGNMYAPDERLLLANCEHLIFIGNTSAHKDHPFMKLPHLHFEEPWLYSRAMRGRNFIGIWTGGRAHGRHG
jgi:hypothetical protein